MGKKLLGNLGQNLLEHYPELRDAQVIPVMGHGDTHTLLETWTYELAKSLSFGTVNVDVLSHTPRAAVKELPTGEERKALLRGKYIFAPGLKTHDPKAPNIPKHH